VDRVRLLDLLRVTLIAIALVSFSLAPLQWRSL
jgi:hypothetical protein